MVELYLTFFNEPQRRRGHRGEGDQGGRGRINNPCPMPNAQFPIINLLKVLLRLAIQG
ncbi:hypothetical protein COO91_05135 [Nostoc flagelliforme CCNUN1]|uniref:Uncharacterized protein n=1 Tax=Nostoc flagelliforme CCNUN1 TaxID=2038116 RepID=A0A2K8SUX6_9NOSO|nr:hypothetical protein COO91_05135 [Nostoc flagelliforme CCNUN1]